ncbi:hypothetical protein HRbin02_01599 [Candidatus Calditenuaceae archaeon HR02]|nr:hypothetical protein HRbin02_01599 [Candidatus Calditenuaceae archaeon HR02]
MGVERVRREMGILERIASYIPGYRGYKEKELRRETDILVRRKVSSLLAEAKDMLNSSMSPAAARRLAYDPEARFTFENLRAEIDRATQRIDKAVAGYAGLFDAVKVKEDKLDAVIDHDLSLIERAERVKILASELVGKEVGSDEWGEKLRALRSAVSEIDKLIDERTNILKGLTEVTD